MDNKTKTPKDYSKKYYNDHKAELIAKICVKQTCVFCGREVQKVNMSKHKKTELCKRMQQRAVEDKNRLAQDIEYYKKLTYDGKGPAYQEEERADFGVTEEQYIRFLRAEEQRENE